MGVQLWCSGRPVEGRDLRWALLQANSKSSRRAGCCPVGPPSRSRECRVRNGATEAPLEGSCVSNLVEKQ